MKITLPTVIRTSEPGSFALRTFQTRVPKIIDELVATNDYPEIVVRSLDLLRQEITSGEIQPLDEDASDKESWNAQVLQYAGKTWLDLPWFWAEAYLYRRILQAVKYFQPGDFYLRDPYGPVKRAELHSERAPDALIALLDELPTNLSDAFSSLLHSSLWSNRVDLSMAGLVDIRADNTSAHNIANLLADDTPRVWSLLQQSAPCRIDILCDNAGAELGFDLALVDFMLRAELASQITLRLKPQPTFVSDATIDDVRASLEAFAQASAPELRELAARLAHVSHEKRLILTDHPFWVSGFFFHAMPDDLRNDLAQATLVISKGDANYRRLVGDCHWPPTARFKSAVAYFPAPVVALRTLKSELTVGLTARQVEQLNVQDPAWRVGGQYGVIQMAKPEII